MTQNKKFPLMPKATAIWLIDNTTLTFKQIADFCGMHELEVKGIADGEVAVGVIADNPITSGQLNKEEIEKILKQVEIQDEQNKRLIEKIKSAVGDKDGSESVSLHFGENEQILKKEFNSVCSMIREVFTTVAKFTADE
mgnify:CR=1 FL=1